MTFPTTKNNINCYLRYSLKTIICWLSINLRVCWPKGDNTGDESVVEALKAYIKKRDNKPGNVYLGLVHRLDRPTSGVMVLAKSSKALPRLNKQFAEKKVKKYIGQWSLELLKKQATLIHYLLRKPKQNKSFAYPKEVPNSKLAELSYEIRKELDRYSSLK